MIAGTWPAAVTETLQTLPERPGVYIMRDEKDHVIYVGKAVVLKNRVRSYFQASSRHSPKVRALVAKIAALEYIVTATEMEALILECNLIKEYHPKYNISLRDDKSYPYVKVTLAEPYPRVYVTRRVLNDGSRYFGPYANAGAVHETIRLIRQLFPLRTCRKMNSDRPCLEYHIKRCLAPCVNYADPDEYRQMVASVMLLLEGRSQMLVKQLEKKMQEAAENLLFERAARLRDQLKSVQLLQEKQLAVLEGGDLDVVGLARDGADSCVQVFFVRGGRMIGRDHFFLQQAGEEDDETVLSAFLQQYYSRAALLPKQIVLPLLPPDETVLAEWLSEKKGAKVALLAPQRGEKRQLLAMAAENARTLLAARRTLVEKPDAEAGVLELGEALGLEALPEVMECFDISHIQGAETVASMVVFRNGEPDKRSYKRFKIASTEGKPDDFRSMQEVVLRRYSRKEWPLPDLVIIDGGKGQLSSALTIIRQLGHDTLPVVSLAKRFEEIYREGESDPVILPREGEALKLVQRIRDEAHRFAITYHRKLRGKRNLVSVLDHIPGVGPARRKALWDAFGSIEKIKAADENALAAVQGMTRATAEAVYRFFHKRPL